MVLLGDVLLVVVDVAFVPAALVVVPLILRGRVNVRVRLVVVLPRRVVHPLIFRPPFVIRVAVLVVTTRFGRPEVTLGFIVVTTVELFLEDVAVVAVSVVAVAVVTAVAASQQRQQE